MDTIEIKAAQMGKTVTLYLPCWEKKFKDQLSALYGTQPSHAVIEVEQIVYPKKPSMLTGKPLDLDAMNYLARRMDGFSFDKTTTDQTY